MRKFTRNALIVVALGWPMLVPAVDRHLESESPLILIPAEAGAMQDAFPARPTLLTSAQVETLLPPAVYFRGKSAPIQLRNAAGVRFGSDGYCLAAMVDTSGYASSVQETYQMYLITERPLSIGGQRLAAGAYGAGVVGGQFILMDVGGRQLLQANSTLDNEMKRPRPLQMEVSPAGEIRLYLGRSFVTISAAPAP